MNVRDLNNRYQTPCFDINLLIQRERPHPPKNYFSDLFGVENSRIQLEWNVCFVSFTQQDFPHGHVLEAANF